MSISIYVEPISKGSELIEFLLTDEFNITISESRKLATDFHLAHFSKLKASLYLLVETNYVDKVFRDSYYHYYSSKLSGYRRDCIRISLFDGEIKDADFSDASKHQELQTKYRGFFILRPTPPFINGRSLVSPMALVDTNFMVCLTRYQPTANGLKMSVDGFPHSSQDTETITCAETTLWAIMEYFSYKYIEYKPVLPSKIIQTLSHVSSERQIPSKGLNITQMSFALREFGFGTRIYSREDYGGQFESLISCYIESGIPLIIAMENNPGPGYIGHALLCVGHEKIRDAQVDLLPAFYFTDDEIRTKAAGKNIIMYDMDDLKKQFVFVDDNHAVYQKAALDAPAAHYAKDWHGCKISYFIVPLYTKIYLEAFEAKTFIKYFLIAGPEPLQNNSEVCLRFFLASSRSFKDKLNKNESFQDDLKGLILETPMPKFIWVAELTTKDLIKQKKANGLVILDATEANINSNKPLILAAFQGKVINFDHKAGILENNILILQEFSIFEHNLNPF
ncbi:MAG: hypothetical protein QM726_04370 [Chitinophagaceae bacterium]